MAYQVRLEDAEGVQRTSGALTAWTTARFSREKILRPFNTYLDKPTDTTESKGLAGKELDKRRKEHEEMIRAMKGKV